MQIDELRALLGEDAANDFLSAFAGRKIWIPTPRSHWCHAWKDKIIEVLGEDKALTLFVTYGGDYVHVSNGKRADTDDARRKVAEMQRQGMSINEMAEAVHKSRRTIFRWLNLPHNKVTGKK